MKTACRSIGLTAILAISGALLAACGAGVVRAQPEPSTAQLHTIRATVEDVHVEARALDCQSGVGYAIEIIQIHVPQDAEVRAGGRSIALTDLARGDLVEVRYLLVEGRKVAERVERIPIPEKAGGR